MESEFGIFIRKLDHIVQTLFGTQNEKLIYADGRGGKISNFLLATAFIKNCVL